MKLLPPSFFARNTVIVAQELLGKIIAVNGYQARIVETEAYRDDPASHAYTRTDRSALMYDTYGHVYVYLIYGMHHCLNFTTEAGTPGAVLIRAVEPLNRIKQLQDQRKCPVKSLCSGPGKLCSALGIDRTYNGTKLGTEIKVYDDGYFVKTVVCSPRIGINEARDLLWRFYLPENEFVSRVKL